MKGMRQRPAAPLQPGQPDVPLAAGLPLHYCGSQELQAPDLSAVPGMRQMLIGGRWLNYRLRRSSRRSIGFVIDDGGLSVAAPLWLAQADVESAILHKQGWIVAKLDEWQARRVQRPAPRLLADADGLPLPYLGVDVTLRLDAAARNIHWRAADGPDGAGFTPEPAHRGTSGSASVASGNGLYGLAPAPDEAASGAKASKADGDADAPANTTNTTGTTPVCELVVPLPPDADPARVRKAVATWLQDEARRIFAERLDHYAGLLGMPYRRLILSSARTRWGSCTADGTIRLNWRLIHLSRHLIDYVVAHELAHLKEMNHSPRFWSVVASLYPDYLSARKALRQHPPEHLPAL